MKLGKELKNKVSELQNQLAYLKDNKSTIKERSRLEREMLCYNSSIKFLEALSQLQMELRQATPFSQFSIRDSRDLTNSLIISVLVRDSWPQYVSRIFCSLSDKRTPRGVPYLQRSKVGVRAGGDDSIPD